MPSFGSCSSEMRKLAGTNPAMATGGYTGSRTAALPPESFPPSEPRPDAPGIGGNKPVTIKMADGSSRTGILLGQSLTSAVLLENGNTKFTLLSRDGDVYREKPIAPKRDWLIYDGSLTGNRYSTLDQINASNVQRLAPVWTFPMPESRPQPRLSWSTASCTSPDGTSCRRSTRRPGASCGPTGAAARRNRQRGGHWRESRRDDCRRSCLHDHRSRARAGFNRFTGQRLWEVEMGSYLESYSATSPPLPVGDLVVVGVAGGEEGARGFLDAYRASTGERVWRFYTIPKRGEPGSETWIGQALEHGCGATWMPGSYDPELDLIYWAIGNPCPDFAGEERLGDNLYTSSVVALEAKTGKLKWYYQFTPHDTHDWDAVQPMVLADEVWEGQAAQAAVSRRSQRDLLCPRSHQRPGAEDRKSVHEGDVGQRLRRRRQADRRSWIDRDAGRDRRLPGRRRRSEFSRRRRTTPSRGCFTCELAIPVRSTRHITIRSVREETAGSAAAPHPRARAQALAELQKGYATGRYIRAMDPFGARKVWDIPNPGGEPGILSTACGLVFLPGDGGLLVLDGKTGKAASQHVTSATSPRPVR